MLRTGMAFLFIVVVGVSILGRTGRNETIPQADPSTYEPMQKPTLFSDAYFLVDRDSGQVILEQNSTERIYPASLTKMMTVLVALDAIADPAQVRIPMDKEVLDRLEEENAAKAGFDVGDEPTALDCMYGSLLPSGADCTEALATYVDGSTEAFVERMNEKAALLGMADTHFTNTTGLHDDNLYSTCRDMAKLLEAGMQNKTFADIMKTRFYTSTPVQTYPEGLDMDNNVLQYIDAFEPRFETHFAIPGFIAGKAGYTIEAQYTLASVAHINDTNLLLVSAHGYKEPHYPAGVADAATVYTWYRDNLSKHAGVRQGESFGTVPVSNSLQDSVRAVAEETFVADLPGGSHQHTFRTLVDELEAPVVKGQIIGRVDIYAYDQKIGSINLTAKDDCPRTAAGMILWFLRRHQLSVCLLAAVLTSLVILIREYRRRFCYRGLRRR